MTHDPIDLPDVCRVSTRLAEVTGLTLLQLRERGRVSYMADARAVACYVLREHTGLSWTVIGRVVRRDHTTAMSAARRVHGDARLLAIAGRVAHLTSVPSRVRRCGSSDACSPGDSLEAVR